MVGRLTVVATPIGNLDDLSPRAVRAFAEADVIACEDTRVTRKLLTRAPSRARLVATHAHNELRMAASLADRIAGGEHVVLVSDAGMPGVSDPGQRLVAVCRERGLHVEVLPGPSAALTALIASGFPSARFCVEGFLPSTGKARRRRLIKLRDEHRTMIFFEGPHRLEDTVIDLCAAFGDERRVALCRELTKVHEEVVVGTLAELAVRLAETAARGECTLVLEGAPEEETVEDDAAIIDALRAELQTGASTRDAVSAIVERTGAAKRHVYDLAQRLVAD